jgi:hypothetical protein
LWFLKNKTETLVESPIPLGTPLRNGWNGFGLSGKYFIASQPAPAPGLASIFISLEGMLQPGTIPVSLIML